MFEGQSAWFSTSVSRNFKQEWVDHGGGEASLGDAQFIFSQDAECQDTLRVFESEAYLDEHLSVFHPSYIKECVKQGTTKKITLGKYFFPPTEVQTIASEEIQYDWKIDGYSTADSSSISDNEEHSPPNSEQKKGHVYREPKSPAPKCSNRNWRKKESSESFRKKDTKLPSGLRNHSTSEIYKGGADLITQRELKVKLNRISPQKHRRNGTAVPHEEYKKTETIDNVNNKTNAISNRNKSTMNEEVDDDYNTNSDEINEEESHVVDDLDTGNVDTEDSEVLRLEDLAKVTGDLQDFIAGTNGCEIKIM